MSHLLFHFLHDAVDYFIHYFLFYFIQIPTGTVKV